MTYLKIKCFLIVSLLISLNSEAQTTINQSIKWSVNEFYNKEVKETTTLASVFETTTQKIKWIQKNGARIYEFEIKEISGSWQDLSNDGELTYRVSFRGNNGTVKFSRSQGKATIETDIPVDGKNILPYIFFVNSIASL